MADYDYMKALWRHFYGPVSGDPASDGLHHDLSRQLDPDLRRQLLALVDAMSIHTEQVSLESFIAGFRVAAGIAGELAGEWYSYDHDEEQRLHSRAAVRKEETT